MRVYFGFTVAGSRSSVEAAKKIVDILQSMGHEVLTSHLLREDAWEADRRMPPQEVFARDMRWLAQCDIFIVGNTHPNCILVPYSRLDELEELVRSWVSPQKT